jgi:hypothetical protein
MGPELRQTLLNVGIYYVLGYWSAASSPTQPAREVAQLGPAKQLLCTRHLLRLPPLLLRGSIWQQSGLAATVCQAQSQMICGRRSNVPGKQQALNRKWQK